MKKSMCILISMLVAGVVSAADYYVDNEKGNDSNPGTKEAPFASPSKALKAMRGGDTVHFIKNKTPYHGRFYLRKLKTTPEKPTVIDGHGSTFDGLVRHPASDWKAEGNGIFSISLPNNAWVMDSNPGCWSGDFPIVYFDGKPGINKKAKKNLEPLSYYLYKSSPRREANKKRNPLHNTLYIMLPNKKTPDSICVETSSDTGIGVEGANYIVRNIRAIHSTGDGFDTCWGDNILFENVEGAYCMDQGISNHSSVGVVVKNSYFHHNTGCGIVDCVMNKDKPTEITYSGCLIENNPFRHEAELRGINNNANYTFENCVIRNGEIEVVQAGFKVKNCLFENAWIRTGSNLEVTRCTFTGAKSITLSKGKGKISNSVFLNGAGITLGNDTSVKCTGNRYQTPKFNVQGKAMNFEKFQKISGDTSSVLLKKELPASLPWSFGNDNSSGAALNPADFKFNK